MAWLKKVGQIVLQATAIVTGLGPLVTMAIPGKKDDQALQLVTDALSQVAGIITQAEIFGAALGLPGTDKLKAATPAVAQIILQSSILARHKIADPVLFQKGCASIASGMADVLNSLEDKVETEKKA